MDWITNSQVSVCDSHLILGKRGPVCTLNLATCTHISPPQCHAQPILAAGWQCCTDSGGGNKSVLHTNGWISQFNEFRHIIYVKMQMHIYSR